jgi:hypothetical protein
MTFTKTYCAACFFFLLFMKNYVSFDLLGNYIIQEIDISEAMKMKERGG